MDPFITIAVSALVSSAVGSAFGGVVVVIKNAGKKTKDDIEERKAYRRLTIANSRELMISRHHECMQRGSVTTAEREGMEKSFAAYTAVGGNGVITTLKKEFDELPTVG